MNAAKKEGIDLPGVTEFQSTTGRGISAKFDGKIVLVGKEKFLRDAEVRISDQLGKEAERLQQAFQKQQFTLEEFQLQLQQIKRMGPVGGGLSCGGAEPASHAHDRRKDAQDCRRHCVR